MRPVLRVGSAATPVRSEYPGSGERSHSAERGTVRQGSEGGHRRVAQARFAADAPAGGPSLSGPKDG
jgi:hypothetical protein